MWTILPLKALQPAKSRLARVFTPEQRQALMKAMVEDVLTALEKCQQVSGILVVSGDPGFTTMAESHGAEVLTLEQDDCLNGAVQAASGYLADKGVRCALILHGDIPLVTPVGLTSLIEQSAACDVALLPCRKNRGSNALIVSLPARMPFVYGADSYDKFLQEAKQRQLATRTLRSPEMALDIDTADDLLSLCRYYREHEGHQSSHTRQFLAGLGLLQNIDDVLARSMAHSLPDDSEARVLALVSDNRPLLPVAAALRDRGHGNLISYSRKVFIPLTHLCRDVCHYCTFAQVPRQAGKPYMSVEEVLEVARKGVEMGCREALLTLGEKPESRYSVARDALAELGFESTLDYVAHVAQAVFTKTGLLPHINAGCMDEAEISMLREYSPSMGIMLESSSDRLCNKGMPHYGSPDKLPARRLETIARAGAAKVPFTSGILIGIGETRLERIESMLELRKLHRQHGHLQEVIIQNFRAKPGTPMAAAPEPGEDELCWTIAVARIIFGAEMNIQAPPNLVPGALEPVIEAGINDLGGISPLTPDYVNPEAPWPNLEQLALQLRGVGKHLQQRLTLYPAYVRAAPTWVAKNVVPRLLQLADGQGFAREDQWITGESIEAPVDLIERNHGTGLHGHRLSDLTALLRRCQVGDTDSLGVAEIGRLFNARGDDFNAVCRAADRLRARVSGNAVSFISNRNINYTNICYFKCNFCSFSKGKVAEDLREKPYDLALEEIQQRTVEARELGATEVCLQGGIHPHYTGQHYIDICQAIKEVSPAMHIHAFSPLEVWQGAETLGVSLEGFLERLQQAGLGSLPGTAAEILVDDVRQKLCADKINTSQWQSVMETAHRIGLSSTATIMFGHVDTYEDWAQHLLTVRAVQSRSGGFTEFVPLPFVARMAPLYRRGQSRRGPTFREVMLMYAVSRLVLHPHITNIQSSWVKLGRQGVQASLHAGVNDLGGTLINESITRSAGGSHGQGVDAQWMAQVAASAGRQLWQRTTLYKTPPKALAEHRRYRCPRP